MKALKTLFILTIGISSYAQQQYTGFSNDNFGGYTSSHINPATIANTTNKFSISSSFVNLNSNNFLGGNTSFISMLFGNEQQRYRDHLSSGYRMNNLSVDIISAYYEINPKNSVNFSPIGS